MGPRPKLFDKWPRRKRQNWEATQRLRMQRAEAKAVSEATQQVAGASKPGKKLCFYVPSERLLT